MAEYVNKSMLYSLCEPRGVVTLHVSDIDAMHSEDVAPVVHGHWIDWGARDDDGNGEYTCSCCDHSDKHSPGIRVPYCWYCGAKMEVEQQDEPN